MSDDDIPSPLRGDVTPTPPGDTPPFLPPGKTSAVFRPLKPRTPNSGSMPYERFATESELYAFKSRPSHTLTHDSGPSSHPSGEVLPSIHTPLGADRLGSSNDGDDTGSQVRVYPSWRDTTPAPLPPRRSRADIAERLGEKKSAGAAPSAGSSASTLKRPLPEYSTPRPTHHRKVASNLFSKKTVRPSPDTAFSRDSNATIFAPRSKEKPRGSTGTKKDRKALNRLQSGAASRTASASVGPSPAMHSATPTRGDLFEWDTPKVEKGNPLGTPYGRRKKDATAKVAVETPAEVAAWWDVGRETPHNVMLNQPKEEQVGDKVEAEVDNVGLDIDDEEADVLPGDLEMEDEEDDAKPDDGSTLSDEHGWREEKTRQAEKAGALEIRMRAASRRRFLHPEEKAAIAAFQKRLADHAAAGQDFIEPLPDSSPSHRRYVVPHKQDVGVIVGIDVP